MSNKDKKRKLGMLTEVLPAPQKPGPETPRQRTMQSLKRLAAAAGAAATIGCGGGGGGGGGGPSGGGGSGGNVGGYAVVDPMPPPARCIGMAATITATIEYRTPELMVLTMGAPRMEGAIYIDATPNVEGGTVGAVNIQPNSVSIEITPTSDAMWISVRASCSSGEESLAASINRSTVPATGQAAVQFTDMY